MSKLEKSFEADTGKILSIVINSLYSNSEIFLRELLSNASDAINKRHYLGQTNSKLLNSKDDKIILRFDKKKKILLVEDTGIGLDQEELIDSLGTIAKSGTETFLEDLEKSKTDISKSESLIGQFGVGFYSAFMVADSVEVNSKKAGGTKTFQWISDAKNGFSVEEIDDRSAIGTQIVLHLKNEAKEYMDAQRLKALVKKYSDHISIPIFLIGSDGKEEQLNSGQALWTRSPAAITDEEHKTFYNSQFSAFDDPFLKLHNKSEGALEFISLLYLPSVAPFDLFDPERKTKLNLYINRIFITNDLETILPKWLRFVRGILDTPSLQLNVSRELLQASPVLGKIKKNLVKRILAELKKKLKKDPKKYDEFWAQFGKVLKEGLYEDTEYRASIAELTRVFSLNKDSLITLEDYLSNLVEGQSEIYYLAADSLQQAKVSPHLEGFKQKGLDVILCDDPIDAFWMSQMLNYKDKPFKSIARDKLDLSGIKEDKQKKDEKEKKQDASIASKAIAILKAALNEKVENIIESNNLVSSPARLVAGEAGLDYNLERLLKAQNPDYQNTTKVLEINTRHEIIKNLVKTTDENLRVAASLMLFEQARILDGEIPSDSAHFINELNMLVATALGPK